MANKTPNHGQVIEGSAGETRFSSLHVANTNWENCNFKKKENNRDTSAFMIFKPAVGWNNDAHNNDFQSDFYFINNIYTVNKVS